LAEPQFSASSYILEALIDKPSFYGYVNIVDYSYFSFTLIIVYDDIFYIFIFGEPDPFLGGTGMVVSAIGDSRFSTYNSSIRT